MLALSVSVGDPFKIPDPFPSELASTIGRGKRVQEKHETVRLVRPSSGVFWKATLTAAILYVRIDIFGIYVFEDGLIIEDRVERVKELE